MALDQTAREANVRDSLRKYLVDSLYTAQGVELLFDTTLSTPNVRDLTVDRWITIKMGDIDMRTMADLFVDFYCNARKDSEGMKLAQLRDKLLGVLVDNTQSDGMARITLYRSREVGAWTEIGGMVVQEVHESEELLADDQTKYKLVTARIRWGTK